MARQDKQTKDRHSFEEQTKNGTAFISPGWFSKAHSKLIRID